MKKIIMLLLITVSIAGIYSCTDSTDPSSDPTVNLYSAMDSEDIALAIKGNVVLDGTNVDSVKVTKYRALISRVKLHIDDKNDDDSDDEPEDDKNLDDGPLVMTGDFEGNEYNISSSTVPAGTYNKMKLEFHRFPSEELATYENDDVFGDFATSDRYTFILEGFIYENGDETGIPFVFNSNVTINLSVKFDPLVVLDEATNNDLYLVFDPMMLFEDGHLTIDPRDPKNGNKIEKAIKNAFKTFKK